MMTRRTSRTYRLDPDLVRGLEDLKERDGVPTSEQVRRAVRMWLDSKGIKADRPRAATRKRS
jgi:Arc/MetJ-type ribon-helix-helix transcriptional regulator